VALSTRRENFPLCRTVKLTSGASCRFKDVRAS
jgi:hypothetical protein